MIPEPGDILHYKAPTPYEYSGPVLVYEYHHCYLSLGGPEHQFLGLKLLTGEVDYFIVDRGNAKYWEKLA